MPAIISNKTRIVAADYFAHQIVRVPTYVYIADSGAWDDDPTPPSIKDSTLDRILSFKDIIAIKRIQSSDVVPVTRRIDWVTGTVYDEYTDDMDLINELNPETQAFYNFYVLTSEFNVYKCLSNNNREPSTTMPSGTSTSAFQTPDGYIWKYLYSLNSNDIFEALTQNFMPCYSKLYNDGSAQWQTQQASTSLTVDHVVVTDGGTGYLSSNPPTVTITGDGSGATAVPVIDDVAGEVTNIIVTNKGSGYTTATVSISGGVGVGSTARAVISPIKGHGSDSRNELGAHYLMIRVTLEGDESGNIATNEEYRKVGLVSEPLSSIVTGIRISVLNPEKYSVNDTVTQQNTGATGTISSINEALGYLYLKDVVGNFNSNDTVSSNAVNSTTPLAVLTSVNLPFTETVANNTNLIQLSGDLLYFSTREPIVRNALQNESLRLIVTF